MTGYKWWEAVFTHGDDPTEYVATSTSIGLLKSLFDYSESEITASEEFYRYKNKPFTIENN